jgi:hypothetical protein
MYSVAVNDGMAVEPGLQAPRGNSGMRETDVTDSFELFDRFSGGSTNVAPEVRLQIAVLEDAVDRISKLRSIEATRRLNPKEVEELREVTSWVKDDSVDWPYAFECCCTSVRLDPVAMRERLLIPGFAVRKRIRKHVAGVVRTHTSTNRRRLS